MKNCSACKIEKPLIEFREYNRPNCHFFSHQCKACLAEYKRAWVRANFEKDNERNKEYNKRNARRIRGMKLKTEYWPELTWEQALDKYEEIKASQGGGCAICKRPETRKGKDLAVDHCHDTGVVRGLLCNGCNRGLGLLGDTVGKVTEAVKYLAKHKQAS